MARKKKSKSKKNSDNMFGSMGGMGDMGMMNAGMGDPFKTSGRKSKRGGGEFDVGFGMGDNMASIGIPTVESDSSNPTNDFGGMGDFSEVGFDEPPQTSYGRAQPQQESQGMGWGDDFDMSAMFGGKKQKTVKEVQQFTHRGKKMVQDPENPNNLIKLSTYKKRYGKSTKPKRQMRNQSGRQSDVFGMGGGMSGGMGADFQTGFSEMKQTYQVGKKVAKNVRERIRAPRVDMMQTETQPDVQETFGSEQSRQEAVRYSVDISFDDGSSTSMIFSSLTEAKAKQRSMLADPNVRSAELSYI